ncbi:integrating conjugative element protein, partial [Pseudomonas aeruginosa]|nr:integrating conjugative element protein [Pseudomonas aeruginosa]
VAANGLATQAVDQQTSLLQQEISNLKTELELRRELASNSPMRVIERGQQRASGSSGVFESAPDADRLDRLQEPANTGNSGRKSEGRL